MFAFKTLTAAALVALAAAQTRFTFNNNGTQLVGYHWSPSSQTKAVPAIVIAHGLGGLQSSRLQPYAQRFADAGYHAITFDYRYWGESSGQPRNIIDVASQQSDYEAAIEAVKKFQGVDGSRVVIWGTSLSGGHVLELGARRPDLAGVIAQSPHVSGPYTVSFLPPASLPELGLLGLEDALLGLALPPIYIPLANKTGELGALTQEGALEGYTFIQPNPPPPGNVFPARFVLQLPFFSPDVTAANSDLPTYLAAGLTDNVVGFEKQRELAAKMSNVTYYEYANTGHFDVYPTKPTYEENVSNQLKFLAANVPI